MKQIQIILLLLFVHSTMLAQFTKSFNDAKEYMLSNDLWSEYEVLNYDACVSIMESIIQITDSPDPFVLGMGLNSSLHKRKRNTVEKLLKIASNNAYNIASYRDDVSEIYPELVQPYEKIFIEEVQSVGNVELAQKLAQMFVDDQVCIGQFYNQIAHTARELGFTIVVNEHIHCDILFPDIPKGELFD